MYYVVIVFPTSYAISTVILLLTYYVMYAKKCPF